MDFEIIRHVLAVLSLLCATLHSASGQCVFPKMLQSQVPWIADYIGGGSLVAYIKGQTITIRESRIGKNENYMWRCKQRVRHKFLVSVSTQDDVINYMCVEFINRRDNVIQIKASDHYGKRTEELCEEKMMTIDPYPLFHSHTAGNTSVVCPFQGGYNMNAYYALPNDSITCRSSILVMRMESECEEGMGIVFNFRVPDCIPKRLERWSTSQRFFCVTHWTQDKYTFIILRHANDKQLMMCLRISDPLINISSAYLWLTAACDTSDPPSPDVSPDYLRLEFRKRIFYSACLDELDYCTDPDYQCKNDYRPHCTHLCGNCSDESSIGSCMFREPYRGLWIDSGAHKDSLYNISVYKVSPGTSAQEFFCHNIEPGVIPDKDLLLKIYTNGCVPRYACMAKEKVSSSVMKFRMGNQHSWPLTSYNSSKKAVCNRNNFRGPNRHGEMGKGKERSPRLLINTSKIKEVSCNLPLHLQNGFSFQEDGKQCRGCFVYFPKMAATYFTIRPINCSMPNKNHEFTDELLQYNCLASFQFANDTYAVVTKTNDYYEGMGDYLMWTFYPHNHIKITKAGEAFAMREDPSDSSLVIARFSINTRANNCQNIFIVPESTSTSTEKPPFKGNWSGTPGDGPYTEKPIVYNASGSDVKSHITAQKGGKPGKAVGRKNNGASGSVSLHAAVVAWVAMVISKTALHHLWSSLSL